MEEQDYRTTFELEERNWWFVGMRRICTEELVRRVGPTTRATPARILDVGCGTGINLDAFAAVGPTTGVDVSPLALGFCRSRGATALVQARGEALPFPDGSFDAVTAIGVVEHIDDDLGALASWTRVLAPGGHLVLLTSAYRWLWSGHDLSNHHARRYTRPELRDRLRAVGLVDDRVTYLNSFLLPPIAAVRGLERLRRGTRPPEPHKDAADVGGVVDRALTGVLGLEARLLARTDLPAGVSILASARRPG